VHYAVTSSAGSDATPLVLLHPWGADLDIWHEVLPALSAGRTVVRVDLPAHGRSGAPPGRYPPRRLAQAVLAVLDALDLPRVVVVGNSIGGATALALAELAPSRAVYSPDAVFTLAATGDVDALIKTLAPPGSPTAAELDTAFARLKEELGVDMREQLAALTGHLAVAVGLADIKMIANIRELMMNPARAMWSTASTGMKAGRRQGHALRLGGRPAAGRARPPAHDA
jgi:pimeloyl-ACP methyl ester carboxylesterase